MGLYSEEGSLRPTPPFDFAKSLDFLGMFPPMREDQTVSELSMTKAVRVCVLGRAVAAKPAKRGTTSEASFAGTLRDKSRSEGPCLSCFSGAGPACRCIEGRVEVADQA